MRKYNATKSTLLDLREHYSLMLHEAYQDNDQDREYIQFLKHNEDILLEALEIVHEHQNSFKGEIQ